LRFPPDVTIVAVRWYLRFGLSYRDVEELLVERGIQVDHTDPSLCPSQRQSPRGQAYPHARTPKGRRISQ
jgi:hypothetical protein